MKPVISIVAALGLAMGALASGQGAPGKGGDAPKAPVASPPKAPDAPAKGGAAAADTIVVVAGKNASLKTFTELVTLAGLAETLNGKGPYTVFAPTDAAFAKLPKETLESLRKDKAKLKEVLLYHVVSGKNMAADVAKMKEAKSMAGAPIMITAKEGKLMLNNSANVTSADMGAGNGVIHVIDAVVMAPATRTPPGGTGAGGPAGGTGGAPAGGKPAGGTGGGAPAGGKKN